MPGTSLGIAAIEILSDTEAPAYDSTWQRDSVLYSRNGASRIRFSGPSEIAMGASTWNSIEIWIDDVNATRQHGELNKAFGLTYAEIEAYSPWDRLGTSLAFGLFGRRHNGEAITRTLVYDLLNQITRFQLEGVVSNGLSWSPVEQLLFLTSFNGCTIVDDLGAQRHLKSSSRSSAVVNAWTPSGNYVVSSPEPKRSRPGRLEFIDIQSGKMMNEVEIDLAELLPFDQERFISESRSTRYVDPTQSEPIPWMGSVTKDFTWQWTHVIYDQTNSSLLLGVYRPTFESISPSDVFPRHLRRIYEDDDLQTLDRHWVRVTLGD